MRVLLLPARATAFITAKDGAGWPDGCSASMLATPSCEKKSRVSKVTISSANRPFSTLATVVMTMFTTFPVGGITRPSGNTIEIRYSPPAFGTGNKRRCLGPKDRREMHPGVLLMLPGKRRKELM